IDLRQLRLTSPQLFYDEFILSEQWSNGAPRSIIPTIRCLELKSINASHISIGEPGCESLFEYRGPTVRRTQRMNRFVSKLTHRNRSVLSAGGQIDSDFLGGVDVRVRTTALSDARLKQFIRAISRAEQYFRFFDYL